MNIYENAHYGISPKWPAAKSVVNSDTTMLLPHKIIKTSYHCQTRRFLSQLSENHSDSDAAEGQQLLVDFGENGDTQRENLTPGNGLIGEEKGDTQMNIFSHSNVEFGEVKEVYEIDLEQLESLLSLLQSSADGFFKWALKEKPEFGVTMRILDALVRATCSGLVRKRDVYSLWDLVKEVGEKENTVVHVEILNELISSFSKLGKQKAVLEVFNKLGKKATDAHLVYSSAANVKPQYLPPASVYLLISSLCREDETVKLALDMLDNFVGEARKYAIKPFSVVVRGLCRIKDVDGAKKLLLEMTMKGPPPGNAVFNMVINGYCMAGDMREAIDMMNLMKSRGLKPDVQNKHPKLSHVTYHTLIRGYCKLEEFGKGLKSLREMKDSGVQPNVDEYNKLIQSVCLKALDWETTEKLL
ncbi:hypothetical protein ACE6H2_016645 [Prunus campanulata]